MEVDVCGAGGGALADVVVFGAVADALVLGARDAVGVDDALVDGFTDGLGVGDPVTFVLDTALNATRCITQPPPV